VQGKDNMVKLIERVINAVTSDKQTSTAMLKPKGNEMGQRAADSLCVDNQHFR